jgi:hypothetical protein
MRVQGEVGLHLFLISMLDRVAWSVSHPGHFTPCKEALGLTKSGYDFFFLKEDG